MAQEPYPDLMIAWYPRHWGQTTATELAKFLAGLPPDTTGITFFGNVEVGEEVGGQTLRCVRVPPPAVPARAARADGRGVAIDVLSVDGVLATSGAQTPRAHGIRRGGRGGLRELSPA